MRVRIDGVTIRHIPDADPDASYLDDAGHAEIESGALSYIGIRAVAETSYAVGNNGDRRLEQLTSGGLWGVELWCRDSADPYLAEIAKEEIADLRAHLEAYGVRASDAEWRDLTADLEPVYG